LKAQILYWYNSSNLNGVVVLSPLSNLDIGVGKRFADDKFTVDLNCTDVFATRVYTNTQNSPGLSIVQSNYPDLRKIRLNITWKFGKSQYHRQPDNTMQNIPLKGAKQ